MDEHATALYESVVAAVPGWIERSVRRFLGAPDPEVMKAATEAGLLAQADVAFKLRALLDADIDEQTTTPLTIVRAAAGQATAVLAAAGVAPVQRDEAQRRLFPDDPYDLAPAVLGDIDPALTQVGLVWGAHKAMTHLQRHGAGS
ncbi:MAG: hypothetical protein M3159_06695 [Actinomycetota bacterium]|nr:hypothetical protein [Actinomycetota bacterium]